jgi:hypothetical protein
MTFIGIPKAPLVLGLAGLLPFWGLMGAMAVAPPSLSAMTLGVALSTYGAVIVSFLGGIRWGLATAAPRQDDVARDYAIAVVPSLLAWGALAFPLPAALAILGVVALGLGPVDRTLALAPAWFGRLRMILSLGAGIALILAAVVADMARAAA